jgi:hypothetical protein
MTNSQRYEWMGPMWNDDDHRALRELLREDDRRRAERACEPMRSPPMRETGDAGIV